MSEPRVSNRWVALGMIALCQAVCFLDRNIVPILAEPIKADLGISDTQIGLLTGLTFAIFYSAFGLPVAALSDRLGRVRVMAISCVLWSIFTALCGRATSFVQLGAMRICVAIGEAGCTPASYSLIADYFRREQRGLAIALFCLGAPAGIAAGSVIAGFIGSAYGWRTAMLVAASAGMLLAPLLWLLVREPRKGRLDPPHEAQHAREPLLASILTFVGTPQILRMAIAGASASIVNYSTLSWMPPFLMRSQGMALVDIGRYYSVVSAGTMAAGMLLGGLLADHFAKRSERGYALIPAIGFLIGGPFFVATIIAGDWATSLILFIVPGTTIGLFGAPSGAVIQNHSRASQRSVINAIYILVVVVSGLGLGPLYVGILSDFFAPGGSPEGLRFAMLAISPFYLIASACFFWASRSLVPRADVIAPCSN